MEPDRSSGAKKYNNWTEKKHTRCSTIEISRKKEESMNLRMGQIKLSSLRSRKKKNNKRSEQNLMYHQADQHVHVWVQEK